MSESVFLVAYRVDPENRKIEEKDSDAMWEIAEAAGVIALGGNHVASRIRELARQIDAFTIADEIMFMYGGGMTVSDSTHLLFDGNWFDAPYHFLRLLMDPELRLLMAHSYHYKWSETTFIDFLANYGKKYHLLCITFE